MVAGRRSYKTDRAASVMWGLDSNDIVVFGSVLLVAYVATDISVSSVILKGLLILGAMAGTWFIWFAIKDTIQPKLAVHLLGWYSTPDLLEIRPTARSPVPLCVALPNQPPVRQQTRLEPSLPPLERPAPHAHPPLEVQP